jgi:hypothetical protein
VTLRTIGRALALLGLLAAPAAAQGPTTPASKTLAWALRGVEFSVCVDFLIDPGVAARQLADGYRIVPAGGFTPLSPLLGREIAGDTARARWVPSQVCVLEARGMSVGERDFTPAKAGEREVVGYWAIAATRSEGAPRQDQWFAVSLWTNDWHVRKTSEAAFVPMSIVKRSLVPVPESSDHRYQVRIGKTILSWDGQLVGRDSTTAATPRPGSFLLDGPRRIRWSATLAAQPLWTRPLPGVFRVEGKDDLAQALKASPIRMFGPMSWGGDARVEFVR